MFKEFKDFIMTGNVIDFAIAVILAGAVGLVVNGFVNDIMMPIVGHFGPGMDFADWSIPLAEAVGKEGEDGYKAATEIRIGAWINTIISLITVGFVLFMMAKSAKKYKEAPAPEAPAGPTQEELLAQIRDLLKK
ncbi:MAG: large conductance mechanosensitive channel protein MscL [Saprospiraceae bacterium]